MRFRRHRARRYMLQSTHNNRPCIWSWILWTIWWKKGKTNMKTIEECCETCKYGCRHGNGETWCNYRQKWQFSEFRCVGYKPNLRTVWKRFIEWLYKICRYWLHIYLVADFGELLGFEDFRISKILQKVVYRSFDGLFATD